MRAVGKNNETGMKSFKSLKDFEIGSSTNINERMLKSKSVSIQALKTSKNPALYSSQSSKELVKKKSRRSTEDHKQTVGRRSSAGKLFNLFFPKSEAE